jgi:rare lipoprotein A (peptidoglycan hydrolase)
MGKTGRIMAVVTASIMLVALTGPAEAHRRAARWWQYEKRVRSHREWNSHTALHAQHDEWHRQHTATVTHEETAEDGQIMTWTSEEPTYTAAEHTAFHHDLYHKHLRRHHRYRVVGRQRGTASWYDMAGQRGACGKVLKGMYAAHRTWPCGTLVAVKRGSRVVKVRVMDRGPFVSGWIIDLAPRAMRRIAGDAGIVEVKIFRLKRRR